ncbi:MAG: hypothetical protein ACREUL_14255 [Steroidobacteraceae bacterium]
MPYPLSEARIRTQRYWWRDGLEEITLGVISLLMGGWSLATSKASWFWPGTLIYILLLVAFTIFVPRIKTAMRERITYPRSGYVDQGKSWRKRVRALVLAPVIVGAIWLTVRYGGRAGLNLDRSVQWAPAVCGIAMAAVSVYVYVRQGLPRILVVGVFAIILGVAVSIECPWRLATGLFLVGVGCAWLCSGRVTMWNYLRTAPPSADEV